MCSVDYSVATLEILEEIFYEMLLRKKCYGSTEHTEDTDFLSTEDTEDTDFFIHGGQDFFSSYARNL